MSSEKKAGGKTVTVPATVVPASPAGGKHASPPSEVACAAPAVDLLAGGFEEGAGREIRTYDEPGEGEGQQQGPRVPYIGFLGEKTAGEGRAKLEAAGIQTADFYLFQVEPLKIKPFSLHLLKLWRLFTKLDDDMEVTHASLVGNNQTFADGFREHLFAVAAVRILDEKGAVTAIVPARLELRGGLKNALDNTLELTKLAAEPVSWGNRSPQHKAGVDAAHVGGRIVTTIYGEVVKPTEKGKRPFNKGHGIARPTPAADVPFFNAWFKDYQPAIQQVVADVNRRFNEAKVKLV